MLYGSLKILISHILACMQRVLVGNGKTITTKKKFIRLLRLQNNRRCGFFVAVFTSGYGAGKGTSAELCGRRSANYKNAGYHGEKVLPCAIDFSHPRAEELLENQWHDRMDAGFDGTMVDFGENYSR